MKATITIQDNGVELSLTPETQLEKLAIRELCADAAAMRSRGGVVLRNGRGVITGLPADSDATRNGTRPVHA